MLYAMAAEGQAPRYFTKIHEKYNFSRRSLVTNFILAAMFLLMSDSWAGLMLLVTGFNIIGYMAAPVSMGALAPKTRIFGLIVFIILALLLDTVPVALNIELAVVITTLMVIYGGLEFRRVGLKNLLYLTLPFILFLVITSPIENYVANAVIAAIFYIVVTDKRYIAFCKDTANKDNVICD
jgi:amino acid transporter